MGAVGAAGALVGLLAGCSSPTAAPAVAAHEAVRHQVERHVAPALGDPVGHESPLPAVPPAYTEDGRPLVYLTFDDGPFPRTTPAILSLLSRAGARATFFLKGEYAAADPQLVRQELADGDAVGDHTWDHPHLVGLSADVVDHELASTRDLLRSLGAPTRCFRPPFGETDGEVETVARSLGLHQYLWTTETRDWTGIPAQVTAAHAEAGLAPGAVIVFHDREPQTRAALAQVLAVIAQRGYVTRPLPC